MAEFSDKSEELAPKPEELEQAGGVTPQPAGEGAAESEAPGELAPEPEEKKEIKLSQPSKEMAKRLLTLVGFKERLTGTKMVAMAGDMRESIYSFKEAVSFLHFNVGVLTERGSGSIGYINPVELEKWVRDVFGDFELAEAIGEKTKENSNYKDQVEAIMPLMEQRLKQCKEIIGEETEA